MTYEEQVAAADEAAWDEHRETHEQNGTTITEQDKVSFIAGRASFRQSESDLRYAINQRLDKMIHPYGDKRINQWSERDSIRELYGTELITDLEDLLAAGTAPEKSTVGTITDGWVELDKRKPETWLPGDRFTIKELREPTIAVEDSYANLVCNGYYVRRGQYWAVSCEVLHVERLVTPTD